MESFLIDEFVSYLIVIKAELITQMSSIFAAVCVTNEGTIIPLFFLPQGRDKSSLS